jgi:hypothetical protein
LRDFSQNDPAINSDVPLIYPNLHHIIIITAFHHSKLYKNILNNKLSKRNYEFQTNVTKERALSDLKDI